MIFRKLRGVNIPYRAQGLIWFTCVNLERQPKAVRDRVRRICEEVGGEYADALFCFLTRENVSAAWIERNYYVGHSLLYAKRVKFFERYYREMLKAENRKEKAKHGKTGDSRLPDLREDVQNEKKEPEILQPGVLVPGHEETGGA